MLWRIAPLETPGRASGLGGVERLVERCRFAGVGIVSLPGRRMPAFVEKVHQHDPFGFRDVDIGEIAQDKGVIDSRAAVFHRHLPPPFEGREQHEEAGDPGALVPDERDPSKVIHSYDTMIDARIVGICCGLEDCDDHDVHRHEPLLKMYCGKTPAAEVGLASQPTLSRLENTVSWRALARMGAKMITAFCDSFVRPPRQIVLDIDDTTDRTHGGQQLSLFNTHAGGYCFPLPGSGLPANRERGPILIFEAATQKPVASILRPGKRPSGEEGASVLRHVIRQIRAHWPRVAITIRGDAHYGTPEVMDVPEDMDCLYTFGLSGNKRLGKISAQWRDDAATRRAPGSKEKIRRFFQTHYSAKSWRKDRRVIARVEATTLGSDVRFIVTNIAGSKAKHLYEKACCARGRMENLPFHRLKVNDCRVTD